MTIRILANDGIDSTGKKLLENAGMEVITNKVAQEDLAKELLNYDGITVRSATKVRKELIDAVPNLKVIARAGVGMDNIDVEYARSKGIRVINTPAASSISVAELVFAHLFNISRNLALSNRKLIQDPSGNFNDIKKASSAGVELKGKTLGIIGFGRIGQETAKIAFGIGMDVLAYDPYVENVDLSIYLGKTAGEQRIKIAVKTVSKEEVMRNADFISLHVPFSAGDKPVIGDEEISTMKNGVGIVNCARGGAVNEAALLRGINSKKVAYAGLDVFENEPPVNTAVFGLDNISVSAHIGASTAEAQERIGIELAEKIIEYFKETNSSQSA